MTLADVLITAAVLAGACWLLYRSVWRRQGRCHGCAGGCGAAPREPAGLVSLGPGRSRGDGAPSPGPRDA